ncbi:MAG TPA: tryptophan synthase subunit alpha [Thermoplasmata archaeon]|nr:tryptophan synthase subunit alpha [Thermoplasmata archaeon]
MRLDRALRSARVRGTTLVVPYLMVDRARRTSLGRTVRALRAAGATSLELGFPFSDPIADGPLLESAHDRSLHDGTHWADLLVALRITSRILPTAVMIYANPLVHRGLGRSMRALADAGATGIIVPDLSFEESRPYRAAARSAGLSLILLAAPGMSTARLGRVARASRAFLYLVSHYGTTGGVARGSTVDLRPLVRAARSAHPGLPILVGFGVRDRPSATRALATGADGVIVGTALEEQLRRSSAPPAVERFLRPIASARAG